MKKTYQSPRSYIIAVKGGETMQANIGISSHLVSTSKVDSKRIEMDDFEGFDYYADGFNNTYDDDFKKFFDYEY